MSSHDGPDPYQTYLDLGLSTATGVDGSTGDQTEKSISEYAGLHCGPRKPDLLTAGPTTNGPQVENHQGADDERSDEPGLHRGPALNSSEPHPSLREQGSTTLPTAEQAAAAAAAATHSAGPGEVPMDSAGSWSSAAGTQQGSNIPIGA